MNWLSRVLRSPVEKSAGALGGYQLMDGWLPGGSPWNWWQCGQNLQPRGNSAIVEACISAYAQTVAACPGGHWRLLDNGGRERVTTSALSRILRKPNGYQTISDFMLNLTSGLYSDGNAYALAQRNDRFEIESLHLMDPQQSAPRLAPDGSLFYSLGGNEIVEKIFDSVGALSALAAIPARDVLHVKLRTRGSNHLKGESPIVSAALDEAASNAIVRQSLAFYMNQSKPSGLLSVDAGVPVTKEQIEEIKERFAASSAGMNQGKTPVLNHGVKYQTISPTARDSQLVEVMGYGDKRIAAVFRVPLSILNLGDQGPQGSTEALMQFWIATGLGFALNHIEEAIGKTFNLFGLPTEYLEFDTAALLRSLFKDRVDAYSRGVQGGIFAPDEARADFELPKAPDGAGKEPRVQQQVVPLSFGMDMEPPTPGATTAPALPPPNDSTDAGDSQDGASKQFGELIRSAVDRYDNALAS